MSEILRWTEPGWSAMVIPCNDESCGCHEGSHWDLLPTYLKQLRERGEGDAADRIVEGLASVDLEANPHHESLLWVKENVRDIRDMAAVGLIGRQDQRLTEIHRQASNALARLEDIL